MNCKIPDGIKILLAGAAAAVIALAPAEAAPSGFRADKAAAHAAAELLRSYGYGEENPVIRAAREWWHETDEAQFAAYPAASEIWRTLVAAGYSEPVTAGILGNVMAEVGGHTLDIRPDTAVGGYYGICMWDIRYTPQITGKDLAGQLEVLQETMQANIEEAGGSYVDFCSLTDEQAAARYFDTYYERSSGEAREQRARNAAAALAYYGTETK